MEHFPDGGVVERAQGHEIRPPCGRAMGQDVAEVSFEKVNGFVAGFSLVRRQ